MNATCPECGKPVGPNALQGLCPECMMKIGLGSQVQPGGAARGKGKSFAPPDPAELAPIFPQLEILELIGQGGMGAVYKARQKELDRIVALKVLPPDIGGDAAFAERFTREARALARLNHPGIVTIHDFGRADGLYFFVMEFVDGVNLRQLLGGGRVSAREALAIVPQICDALQFAHDHQIVHRDIKPENILLDRQGRVKVADFGLAKIVGAGGDTEICTAGAAPPTDLTGAGKVVGTPAYMAPEQIKSPAEVDHRADIYALGVVLYQMLTGELPGKPLASPSTKVHVDVRLDEVVLRALEKEPQRRYQQVSDVKTAVDTIVQTASSDQLRAPAGPKPTSAPIEEGMSRLRKYGYISLATSVGLVAVWFCLRMLFGWPPTSGAHNGVAPGAPFSASVIRKGDIDVSLNAWGTVESSNSVEFAIAENYCNEVFHRFDAHQTLPVVAYDRDKKFGQGFLTGMDNQIDTASGTLKCRARLVPDGDNLMIPGLVLKIRMLLDTKHAVPLVPADAIGRDSQGTFAWVIQPDHRVARRAIQLGVAEGQWAEIQSGLTPGEIVVRSQGRSVRDGQKIEFTVASDSLPTNSPSQPTAVQETSPQADWLSIQPLEAWITDAQSSDPKIKQMAEGVLTQLGTNTLPGILKFLNESTEQTPEADNRRAAFAEAVKYLGPAVKSALPAFDALLRSGQQAKAFSGARALAFAAPIAGEAFSILTNALADPAVGVRAAATHGMGWCLLFFPNDFALPALPLLARNLKDSVDHVRADTAAALRGFTQRQCQFNRSIPDFLVPALLELLHDKYSFARTHAAYALACSCFRDKLKPSQLEIQKLLDDPDANVRRAGTNLVQMLSPKDSGADARLQSKVKDATQPPVVQETSPLADVLSIQPLETWITDAQSSDPKVKKMAELALTQLGTNTLPGILKFLNESTEQTPEADDRRVAFAEAVKYLGPAVKSALPAFETLLRSGQQEKAYSGARALAFAAPIAGEAFSILTIALADPATGVRDAANHGVGWCLSFDPNDFALPALHLLGRNLKDPVDYVRADTAAALMGFTQRQCDLNRPEPDFLVPALLELLHDKYSFARTHAAYALACSCFRERLKPSLPEIKKLLDDPDENARRAATHLVQVLSGKNAGADARLQSSALFQATVAGTTPLSYQWYFSNTNLTEQRLAAAEPRLENKVKYSTEEASVQDIVQNLARQAGLEYDREKSLTQTDPLCRKWVQKVTIDGKTCRQALEQILKPVDLRYQVENGVLVLAPADSRLENKVKYSAEQASVQDIVQNLAEQVGLKYDRQKSFAQTDPLCRNWVRNVTIDGLTCQQALFQILQPVGLRYQVEDGVLVLSRQDEGKSPPKPGASSIFPPIGKGYVATK